MTDLSRIPTLCLQGGGPFAANDALDAELLANRGGRLVVLPTADAFEQPQRLVDDAHRWAQRLGLTMQLEPLMVLRRAQAMDHDMCAAVRDAAAVYLVGDQPLHLKSVLKDTPLWDAIRQVLVDGGVVTACGASAAGLCDPMVDPRGGAFALGLGLIKNLALITAAETWSPDRLHRTIKLSDTTLAELRTGSALVHANGAWREVGEVVVHGALPTTS